MMRRLAPLALLIATCAPAHAQTDPLVAEAGAARYALAAGSSTFLDSRDPVSRATFEQAMGGDSEVPGDLWSQIMAGGIQLRREYDGIAETLWFNPLFDAGLATGWELGPDGWRAVAAVPVTGEMLRGEAVSLNRIDWTGGALKDLMEARARATWQAAQERIWIGLSADDSGTAATLRAHLAQEELDRMRIAPGYEGAVLAAWQLLTTGDETALPEPVRGGLAITGFRARETLRPVAAFERTDGWTLAMQSPDAPRLTWLAHFTHPEAGGMAALRRFQLVDMGEGQ